MPLVVHTAMVSTTGAMVPSHCIFAASNWMPAMPAACIAGKALAIMPMLVPSGGATL